MEMKEKNQALNSVQRRGVASLDEDFCFVGVPAPQTSVTVLDKWSPVGYFILDFKNSAENGMSLPDCKYRSLSWFTEAIYSF